MHWSKLSAERRVFKEAAAKVAAALVASRGTLEERILETENNPRRLTRDGQRINRGMDGTRTRHHPVCDRKIWGNHPDLSVRNIAWAQSHAQHAVWGPCKPKAMTMSKDEWRAMAKKDGGTHYVREQGGGLSLVMKG